MIMKVQHECLFLLTCCMILMFDSIVGDECRRPMGLQSGAVRDAQLSARCIATSPLYAWAFQARLNNASSEATSGAWVACDANRTGLFLQVDFLKVRNVSGLMTQGQNGMYTASYQLVYSMDGQRWSMYQDEDATTKVFDGNTDDVGTVTQYFDQGPITARYIRILPLTYGGGNFALRLEILGCAWCDADSPCIAPAVCEDLVDDYECHCTPDCMQGKNCQLDYCGTGTMPSSEYQPSSTEIMTTAAKSCASGLQPWERALIVIFTICPLAALAVVLTFLTQRYLRLQYQMTTVYGRPVSPQPSIISYDVSKVIKSGYLQSYDVSRSRANQA
ncbi:EGF-like repeat and discoidin I-like domain-containing protein 3 isoform X1 [Branchiostoma floridae]|uniref:EGF-like repeat and discoidin I-like domain-containing protein 3 isoform X1 n=2 Tax=Branchiostoma floridae TaxID=7739 RepID=A0A9J7LY69_BRAFL|nr:EGF-like repeat and discoidin I-like domain-containing protein 3 isoform X1 [Branchiostoma floridae]